MHSGRPGIGMAQAAFGTLVAMDGSAPLDRAEVLLFWLCVPAMCDLPFEEVVLGSFPALPGPESALLGVRDWKPHLAHCLTKSPAVCHLDYVGRPVRRPTSGLGSQH